LVNIVDPILVVVFSLFALRGYFKGLFRESFSLLGFVAGLTVAVRYDEPVAVLWASHWNTSFLFLRALVFVALFFIVYILSSLAGWLLHRSSRLLFLQGINRVGGVLLGAAKGTALIACTVFFLLSAPFLPQPMRKTMDESYLTSPLYHLARVLIGIGKSALFPRGASQRAGREMSVSFF